jgi:hypothetical protein
MCVDLGNKHASWVKTTTLHSHQACVQILENKHASWVEQQHFNDERDGGASDG